MRRQLSLNCLDLARSAALNAVAATVAAILASHSSEAIGRRNVAHPAACGTFSRPTTRRATIGMAQRLHNHAPSVGSPTKARRIPSGGKGRCSFTASAAGAESQAS